MKINELFENIVNRINFGKIKSSEYPLELNDEYEIADYIQQTSSEDASYDLIVETFKNCNAVLRLLTISTLKPGPESHHIKDPKKEIRYLKKNPEYMPPIVVENNTIWDGHHRFRVAKVLGLKKIWAYVVHSKDEPF